MSLFAFILHFFMLTVCCSTGTPGEGYITLKNLGCWRDGRFRLVPGLEGKSSHLDGSYPARKNAIQKCARAAWERGYRAFVLQNGGWCGSSSNAIFKYSRLGRAEECASNGRGGLRANQVYEIKASSRPHISRGPSNLRPSFIFDDQVTSTTDNVTGGTYEFVLSDIGCWSLPPSGVRIMEGLLDELDGHYRSRTRAITKCAKGVANSGYRTMAMLDGGKCLVVDDIEAVAIATRRKPLCSHTGKGTASSIQVYEIRYSDTRFPPPPLPTSSTTSPAPSTTSSTTTIATTPASTLPWIVDPVVVRRTLFWTSRPRVTVQHRNDSQVVTVVTPAPRKSETLRKVPNPRPPTSDHFHLTDLGCWSYVWNDTMPSLEGASNILDGHYSQRSDAVRKCATVASQLGFDVFAIQDGGRCASSENARQEFARHGRSSYCRQDGRGGSWTNQVYELNVVWEVRVSGLGCFKAGSPNVIESLEGTSSKLDGAYFRRKDAIRKCARLAASRGFEVFALHDGGECLSSVDARNRHSTLGQSSECPMSGRGGFMANEVYEVISADKTTSNKLAHVKKVYLFNAGVIRLADIQVKIQSLGCWRESEPRAVPSLEETDGDLMDNYRIRDDAVGKCASVAWRSGLSWFVLREGGWCGGSMSAGSDFRRFGVSEACKPDGQGGHRASQVYEILDETP